MRMMLCCGWPVRRRQTSSADCIPGGLVSCALLGERSWYSVGNSGSNRRMAVRIRYVLLIASAITLIFFLALYQCNIVVLQIDRRNFDGGQIALSRGTSIGVEPGSGTSFEILTIRGESSVQLKCRPKSDTVDAQKGYLETGPIQFLKIEIENCAIVGFDRPYNIFRLVAGIS